MYELSQGSARLAGALESIREDPNAIQQLARILNYNQGQLKQDIQAMYDYRIMNDTWSNNAATGYAIASAQAIGLDHRQTAKLVDAMTAAFDNLSLSEARDIYEDGDF